MHIEIINLSSKHRISKFEDIILVVFKLDGVGPVDNRPSTNKLHHFVQKKMLHLTRDT